MTKISVRSFLNICIISLFVSLFSLVIVNNINASEKKPSTTNTSPPIRYQPPSNSQTSQDFSDGGHSRGGCLEDKIPLTIIAPRTHIGLTTNKTPTFVWFVSSNHLIELRIFELRKDNSLQKIGDSIMVSSSPGFTNYSLVNSQLKLEQGKQYLWEVVTECDNDYVTDRAEIQLIEPTSTIKNQLSTTVNPFLKANIYALSGIWYDSLAEIFYNTQDKQLTPTVATLLKSLVESENPTEWETRRKIQDLQAIANNIAESRE
jgi:hypothetical protein